MNILKAGLKIAARDSLTVFCFTPTVGIGRYSRRAISAILVGGDNGDPGRGDSTPARQGRQTASPDEKVLVREAGVSRLDAVADQLVQFG